MKPHLLAALLALTVGAPTVARAQDELAAEADASARFALVIGVNRSVDPEPKLLRYADDDAARYLELFRALGARSYVLTRPDSNTTRLHPQVAAEALAPVRADFERAGVALAADVAQARGRGVHTVLYVVYAGHGNLKEGRGYLALEDSRLDAADLERLVRSVASDQTHFIVDACYSYFLTLERGPGGNRRELRGFALGGLARTPSVGLLLSTSSTRESHEWSGVEAGVFSHQVRSGLYGAADVDGDGRVSYREMAAFIHRANSSVLNERFRPDVIAHPPADSDTLADLRQPSRLRIEVPGRLGGHYFLEDGRGIRFADFHNGATQAAYLLRPASAGRLYLRRLPEDVEFLIPPGQDVVSLAELTPTPPRSRGRGAANDAFEALFQLPFDRSIVGRFALVPREHTPFPPGPPLPRSRLYTGIGLFGLATASAVAGSLSLLSAQDLTASAPAIGPPGLASRIGARRRWGALGFGVAGAAAAAGLGVLLWPHRPPPLQMAAGATGAQLTFHRAF
jgi:hypothetical protein